MRITNKDLENKIDLLNEIKNTPMKPYKTINGKLTAQTGNYHIAGAYGGVNVHEIMNTGGGVRTPLGDGYFTKKELYSKINAFIRGLEIGKNL